MEYQTLTVEITLTEEMLGTAPSKEDLYVNFVQSKAEERDPAEVEAFDFDDELERGTTVFPRTEGGAPGIWDYQIKGFLKEACRMLKRADGDFAVKKVKAFLKEVDGLVFVEPRLIPIRLPEGVDDVGVCERPLRATTAQGERVALTRSETVPAGSTFTARFVLLNKADEQVVRECLDYGRFHGLGQWRNSGKGSFVWREVEAL